MILKNIKKVFTLKIITYLFPLITILLGTIGQFQTYNDLMVSFIKSLQLFALSLPDNEVNGYTIAAFLTAIVSIFLFAIIVFFKDVINQFKIKSITKKPYTVVFGLGEINRSFLNNIQDNREHRTSTLIIEKDSNNKFIEEYKQKGFAILIANSYDLQYNYENMQHAIIAFGEDRHNIDFARKIIQDYNDEKNDLKLIVHIQNKDLEILFHTKFVDIQGKRINIKTFSFYEEVAKDLFNRHYIDGDTMNYIESDKEFRTIVVADGILLEKILYQIALISHLPNENIHTVTIVDKEADKLLSKVKKVLYYQEENFTTLKLEAKKLDYNSLEFYNSDIWGVEIEESNLVNVIIGFDDEKRNLDIAVELYNRIYLKQAIDKLQMPKILFGIYDELILSKIIDENKSEFNNFFTFGNVNNTLNYTELIDEESDFLGKLIHYTYEGFLKENKTYSKDKLIKYNELKNSKTLIDINNKWYDNSTYNDKLSSIAQTKLIDIKLKFLGLKRIKCKNINIENLMTYNRNIFDSHLDEVFCGKYNFPLSFNDTKFKKLIRLEHNRWNAFHYLNGWTYDHGEKEQFNKNEKDIRKLKKIHDCLLKIEYFDKDSIKDSIFYDIYSFMYIPNYLSEAEYKIVEY